RSVSKGRIMSDNYQGSTPEQDENKLIAERRSKLARKREQGNAFPNSFRREDYCGDLQEAHKDKTKEELAELNLKAKVAGRVMLNLGAFMVIQAMSGRIQLYVERKGLSQQQLDDIETWDLGDIVGVEGILHRPGKCDLYVNNEQCE